MADTQCIPNGRGLSTFAQAREIAQKLGTQVGGGVLPETNDPKTSGIYTLDWLFGPAAFPEPQYTDPTTGEVYYLLRFRLKNGVAVMQPGYIADKFRRYANDAYVFGVLAKEADESPKENG